MNIRGSYWAELAAYENVLVPAGVLVASKTLILFKAYPEFIALEIEMESRLLSMLEREFTPDDILDYYADRSNGVTFSVSRPERMDARSLDDAAEKMLEESKHHV